MDMLSQLLSETHTGPVFGPGIAVGEMPPARMRAIEAQTRAIAEAVEQKLHACLKRALPDQTAAARKRTLQEVVPKATAFVPALTAGELPDTQDTTRLILAAAAVVAMYIGDQLTDRGDEAMLLAIELFCGDAPDIPDDIAGLVASRVSLMEFMRDVIYELSETDGAAVLDCFDQQVLRNEARLHRLSRDFQSLDTAAQAAFLDKHAAEIARLMVQDAGFQSVTSSLHAVYRAAGKPLPPVQNVHADPAMQKLIQICNAVARVADERGDWWMDAGNDTQYGIFSINPFNQYHPVMVRTLCELAGMDDADQIASLQHAFQDFHRSTETRKTHGVYITETFFNQMRRCVITMPPELSERYRVYAQLCMRVGEISYVNMLGDIHMASTGGSTAKHEVYTGY